MTPILLRLHRWLGLVTGVLVLVAALTALGLNHRDQLHRLVRPPVQARDPLRQAMRALAVDPADARRMLLGTADGLYRSGDGGTTWEEVVMAVPAEGVVAIAFDPAVPGRVYVALEAIGVFRSDDHGDIWEEVGLPFQPPEGTHLRALSLGAGGDVLLATTAGLMRLPAAVARSPLPPESGSWTTIGHAIQEQSTGGRTLDGWLYELHDGRIWGTWGVPLTDAVALALIALVVTGYVLYGVRSWRGRRAAARRTVASVTLHPEVTRA